MSTITVPVAPMNEEDIRKDESMKIRPDQLVSINHETAKMVIKKWLGVRPVVFLGKPGVGKTQIVKDVALELGYNLEVLYPSGWDPTDFKGFGYTKDDADGKRVSEWARHEKFFEKREKDTFLMIDELTNASHSTQAELLEMFREHTINGQRLPDNVHMIGAGNLTDESMAANDIIEPLSRRAALYYLEPPTVKAWVEWMLARNLKEETVMAYLNFNPTMMHYQKPTDILYCCPSSWTDVVEALLKPRNKDMTLEEKIALVGGAVGGAAAMEYEVFAKLGRDVPKWEDVLYRRVKFSDQKEWAYLMLTSIALNAVPAQVDAVVDFLETLHPEMGTLFTRSMKLNDGLGKALLRHRGYINYVNDVIAPMLK